MHKKEHSCFLHINALTLFYYKIVLSVVPYKLEFARFYKRCTGRTKSAMGACSQSADFRTGCIARQRDMSMKRSVMRMAPHYDNIFSCIGCFFSFQIFTQSFPTHSSAIGEFFHISTISPSSSELLPILIGWFFHIGIFHPICIYISLQHWVIYVYFKNLINIRCHTFSGVFTKRISL